MCQIQSFHGYILIFEYIVSQLQSEVEKPLLNFRENFKKDMKRFDHHIADLRKQLVGRYAAVEKVQSQIDVQPTECCSHIHSLMSKIHSRKAVFH